MNKQLVKIRHVVCGEPTYGHTVIWVPDDMSMREVENKVRAAKVAYLERMQTLKLDPPNAASKYSSPEYKKYPNLTVKEVNKIHERERLAYDAWEETQKGKYNDFTTYLEAEGLTGFWEVDMFSVECNWGHNHGVRKGTDETPVDTWPSVKVMRDAIDEARSDY